MHSTPQSRPHRPYVDTSSPRASVPQLSSPAHALAAPRFPAGGGKPAPEAAAVGGAPEEAAGGGGGAGSEVAGDM